MESNLVLKKGRDRSKLSPLFDGKDFKDAFGSPGIEPRWTRGNKEGVGTAYSADSKVWFTLWRGTLTEAYYPTVDRPQMRDMEFLITDGMFSLSSLSFLRDRMVLCVQGEVREGGSLEDKARPKY